MPDCVEVVGLDVLVLEVEGVLPDIDADKRLLSFGFLIYIIFDFSRRRRAFSAKFYQKFEVRTSSVALIAWGVRA